MFVRFTIVVLFIVAGYGGALETKDFLRNLTSDDHKILRSIAHDHEKYENLDQALEDIKAKSEKLHTKVLDFKNSITEKIEKLDEDAKKFAKETLKNFRSILTPYSARNGRVTLQTLAKTLKEARDKYNSLSDESKSSLKEHLPDETDLIENAARYVAQLGLMFMLASLLGVVTAVFGGRA